MNQKISEIFSQSSEYAPSKIQNVKSQNQFFPPYFFLIIIYCVEIYHPILINKNSFQGRQKSRNRDTLIFCIFSLIQPKSKNGNTNFVLQQSSY
jgi:hypothetical protein